MKEVRKQHECLKVCMSPGSSDRSHYNTLTLGFNNLSSILPAGSSAVRTRDVIVWETFLISKSLVKKREMRPFRATLSSFLNGHFSRTTWQKFVFTPTPCGVLTSQFNFWGFASCIWSSNSRNLNTLQSLVLSQTP